MAGQKGKSGGKREGSGRPKKQSPQISERVKRNYIKAAKQLSEEYGESLEKAVLRLAYLKDTQDTVKIAVLKAYSEALIVKESVQNLDVKKEIIQGPAIGLPPQRPDPATHIPINETDNSEEKVKWH